jgi:hypothetical protein
MHVCHAVVAAAVGSEQDLLLSGAGACASMMMMGYLPKVP